MPIHNFLRFRKRVPDKGPPPKNFADLFYDAASGKFKANDSDHNPVMFDADPSTADLAVSDGTTAAAAGALGEYLSAAGSVELVNYTAAYAASITLTPGDWDVEGGVRIIGELASISSVSVGINTALGVPTSPNNIGRTINTTTADSQDPIALPRRQFRVTTDTTVSVVAVVSFSAGAASAYGTITARRLR